MKRLILIYLLLTGSQSIGQINIEIIDSEGNCTITSNDTSQIYIDISPDTSRLAFDMGTSIAYYDIDSTEIIQSDRQGEKIEGFKIHLVNDKQGNQGFVSVVLWCGIKTAEFEYQDGSIVINSGEGISYFY